MPELTCWSWEDVMPQSCLHCTEDFMCRNHRAGLVVKTPRPRTAPSRHWQLRCSLPMVAAGWFFWNGSPSFLEQWEWGLQGGEERVGSGVVFHLGQRLCPPYRAVNQDINQCYGAWDGVRYLWFEACWQGSASPES